MTVNAGAMRAPAATVPLTASHQAYLILHFGFVVLPIVAGLDKFANLLTNWEQYLWPALPNMLHMSAHGFMMIVGIIEIVAGLLVAWKPRIFAYVVAAWLIGIILNLLLIHNFYDVALRDFGLCLGAVALARLSLTEAAA